MTAPLVQQISDALPHLSRAEQRVARHVLAHPEQVVDSTLAAVAAASEVSEPTVIRFCASMGLSGFQDFRRRMTQFLALGVPATHSAIESDDSVTTVTGKIFDHTISSLGHTRQTIDAAAIEEALGAILAASSLHFYGMGASSTIAFDAAQKAPLFNKPCNALADGHQQFIEAASAQPDELFFLISYTGRTPELLRVAEEVAANGARSVAITGSEPSPLAETANIVIRTPTLENTDLYTPTISRIAGLVVIDILATSAAMHGGPDRLDRLTEMKAKLAGLRSAGAAQAGEDAVREDG
ncbi:SIS domain-containing protein [Sediminivirga luteola]|uniref:RpiR family transcriptional regulator n=1 Tax=Sediminivirga luteola TaxID=1774748 RepID=A0A8J2TZG6_9MICO|nr:SIS domain-containing protein [Sediminivirga luteola]GGA19519.1 RpiR family transcriptional regulator [Sediminivirga luteola]